MTGSTFVLTGGRGQGKTTLCRQAADRLTNQGWRVAGLLSPARFESGEKTGILAMDLRTGESRLLASRHPGEIQGVSYGTWVFDLSVLEWGNQVIQLVIDGASPADLVIVDEIGPLEFERGFGWTNVFDIRKRNPSMTAMIVVRPENLADAEEKLGPVKIFDLSTYGEQALVVMIEELTNAASGYVRRHLAV